MLKRSSCWVGFALTLSSSPIGAPAATSRDGTGVRAQVLLAMGLLYFVWGSTYLAIRVTVETLHPLAAGGVRFILAGRGIFHIHPRDGAVLAIEVGPGDLLRVPRGTWHWFDLCADRRIRAIRLFQDPAGWTPRYTESGVAAGFEPVCLGPTYLPTRA